MEEDELRISVGVDQELYPDLYRTLLPMGKGKRSEMLRVLAHEALTVRKTAAALLATQAPPPPRQTQAEDLPTSANASPEENPLDRPTFSM